MDNDLNLKHSLEACHTYMRTLTRKILKIIKKKHKKLPGCLFALRIYSLDILRMLEFQNLKKGMKVSYYSHNHSK